MELAYRGLKDLLLSLSEERSLDSMLKRLVDGLAAASDVALARVWLIAPGDICDVCPRRDECERHVPCLQLAASAGNPRDRSADWSRLDGDFRRFPLGVRKIGEVGEGRVVCIEEIADDARWIARPDWARREGIRGFGGAPLRFQGEVSGALGVFTRSAFDAESVEWLRILADHAATSIANARAFDEIARLRRELELENAYLREEVDQAKAFGGIIGRSPAIRAIEERIDLVAGTEATVLIQGESGTGKELVAREIHRRSERAEKPLIQVNCAAIPRDLYESEFFGHVRGAFTGATRDREGRFAAAHGGTLFLDEVGELPLELQGKLLRVLQEGTYERVGEERTRHVDVRVVAATNRDLAAEVSDGRFREDLYYRLDVFPIHVPPLRDRRSDIGLLAAHFLARAAARLARPGPRLTQRVVRELERYAWPGNVRELQNVVERAVITGRLGALAAELGNAPNATASARDAGGSARGLGGTGAAAVRDGDSEILDRDAWRALERENLRAALVRCRWKVAGKGGAAELLGMNANTLRSRMQRLEIERPI